MAGQVLYGWAGSGSRKGYQVIGYSGGISMEEVKYLEMNAMPQSFSPGDFEQCLRRYTTPEGNIAFSYVRNAGRDDLGRIGAYYVHFIVVPYSSGEAGFDAASVVESFLADAEEASYIMRNFTGDPIPLPEIRIGGPGRIPVPSGIFLSRDDLAAFLNALARGDVPVYYEAQDGKDSLRRCFIDLSRFIEDLPSSFPAVNITTYSSRPMDEFPFFRIFLLAGNGAVESASPGVPHLSISGGKVRAGPGAVADPEFLALAGFMWDHRDRYLQFRTRFDALPAASGALFRVQYAMREVEFSSSRDMDLALSLILDAPSGEVESAYMSELVPLLENEADYGKASRMFLDRLEASSPSDISQVLLSSIGILSMSPLSAPMAAFLKEASAIYSRLGDRFPYAEVFHVLSDKDGIPSTGLSRFLLEDRAAFRRFVLDVLASGNGYRSYGQVASTIGGATDREQSGDMADFIFFKAVAANDTMIQIDFLEKYFQSGNFDPDTGARIFKEVAKGTRRNRDPESTRMLRSFLVKLADSGIQERTRLKLTRLVETE